MLIQGSEFFPIMNGQKQVKELTYLEPLVVQMLDQLAWWAIALKKAREEA